MGQEIEPSITGERRAGDIRHCLADIDLARSVLDYAPRENFDKGLAALAAWVARQRCDDRAVTAWAELAVRALAAYDGVALSLCRVWQGSSAEIWLSGFSPAAQRLPSLSTRAPRQQG